MSKRLHLTLDQRGVSSDVAELVFEIRRRLLGTQLTEAILHYFAMRDAFGKSHWEAARKGRVGRSRSGGAEGIVAVWW